MKLQDIEIHNVELLRQKSTPVTSVEEAKELLDKLKSVLSKHDNGIGLSAIQIGIPKQVGIIALDGGYRELINASIIDQYDEIIFLGEGCLSFPDLYFDTKRYNEIVVENYVIDGGNFVREEFVSLYDQYNIECIAIQHELDHQIGVIFQDRQSPKLAPRVKTDNIGRNDPCPCGAKKPNGTPIKYKNCCLK